MRVLVAFLTALDLIALPAMAQPTTTSAPAMPQSPGHHRLYFKTRMAGKDVRLAYAIYLPPNYEKDQHPRPMVVFLNGAGEVGDNHDGLYVHGPLAELKRNKDLSDWADFIALAPQCPSGMQWDAPGLAKAVMEVVEHAKRSWRVDPDRVYLTGLSMGGRGVWFITLASQGAFAAIAPICANEIEPDKMPAAVKGTTVWIIVGAADGDYTEGSRRMARKLAAKGIDTVLTEVPNGDHGVWGGFYPHKEFYEFLFAHRRGTPPPRSRPTNEQLLAIAFTYPNSVDQKMRGPFKKFLPYWQLLNCGPAPKPDGPSAAGGPDMTPGLKPEISGRKNVFVTAPLDAITPSRMITTFSVPKGKLTTLELVVGRHPRGAWQLVIRGNEQELLRRMIGQPPTTGPASRPPVVQSSRPSTASGRGQEGQKGGREDQRQVFWEPVSLDLSQFAGEDVRMELLNASASPGAPGLWAAYWAQVDVKSRDIPWSETPAPYVARRTLVPTIIAAAVVGLAALVLILIGLRAIIRRSARRREG
ncbi:MAG: hypothetical protein ACE15C_16940 [Phycisphaerae bacterium]